MTASRGLSRSAGVLLALVAAAGCSTAPKGPDNAALEAAKAKAAQSKRVRVPGEVAPGFEIRLAGFGDDSLNRKFRIEFEGKLKLPYDVTVETEGLNKEGLRQRVLEAFSRFFKTPQSISVAVTEERYWIDVRGLVEKPGRFLIKSSTSLDEALALAGGFARNSTVRYVKFQQPRNVATIKLSEYYAGSPEDRIPPWQGGDILFFQSERGDVPVPGGNEGAYVQLLGEIRSPGEYRHIKGVDFYYFLAKAGGPTERADLREVQIIRNSPDGKTLTTFSLSDPADVPPIQSGDLIFMPAEKPTKFERSIPLLGGVVGIVNTLLLMILLF